MNEQKQPMQAEREYGPLETAAPVVLNPNAPAAPASALAGSGFWRRLWALVHKEVRQLLRDPGNLGVGMGLPIILILLLIGGLPVFPHSRAWGYGPSGIIGVVLVVLLVLLLIGYI